VVGGDINFDNKTGEITGVGIQVGGTASVSPFMIVTPIGKISVEGHVKQTWNYVLFDVKEFIVNTISYGKKSLESLIQKIEENAMIIGCRGY